jgi:predicted proteasome-type protease
MAYEMQPYFLIGKPSFGEPVPARAYGTEIHLEDVETIKMD